MGKPTHTHTHTRPMLMLIKHPVKRHCYKGLLVYQQEMNIRTRSLSPCNYTSFSSNVHFNTFLDTTKDKYSYFIITIISTGVCIIKIFHAFQVKWSIENELK